MSEGFGKFTSRKAAEAITKRYIAESEAQAAKKPKQPVNSNSEDLGERITRAKRVKGFSDSSVIDAGHRFRKRVAQPEAVSLTPKERLGNNGPVSEPMAPEIANRPDRSGTTKLTAGERLGYASGSASETIDPGKNFKSEATTLSAKERLGYRGPVSETIDSNPPYSPRPQKEATEVIDPTPPYNTGWKPETVSLSAKERLGYASATEVIDPDKNFKSEAAKLSARERFGNAGPVSEVIDPDKNFKSEAVKLSAKDRFGYAPAHEIIDPDKNFKSEAVTLTGKERLGNTGKAAEPIETDPSKRPAERVSKLERVVEDTFGGLREQMERARIRLFDRGPIKVHEHHYQMRHQRSEHLNGKLEGWNDKLVTLKAGLERHDEAVAKQKAEGRLSPNLAAKMTTERRWYLEKIETAERKREAIQGKLERSNDHMARFENQQKEFARRVIDNINEHLAPHEQELGKFKGVRDQLSTETDAFETQIKEYLLLKQDKRQEREESDLRPERSRLKREEKDIGKLLKETRDNLALRQKEVAAVDARLIRVGSRIDKWKEVRNEFAGYTNRHEGEEYRDPGAKRTVVENRENRPYSFERTGTEREAGAPAPEITASQAVAPDYQGTPTGPEAATPAPERPRVQPRKFAEEWNKRYGSRYRLGGPEARQAFVKAGLSLGTEEDIGRVEKVIGDFIAKKLKGKRNEMQPDQLTRALADVRRATMRATI